MNYKLNSKLVFVFILWMNMLISYSQENNFPKIDTQGSLPNVVPPAPDVASLARMSETNVDLFSGAPQISYPLYSNDFMGLKYQLALSYDTRALKVDEQSSWVGTGWNLSEGGAISRTVVGMPDETNLPTQKLGVYYNNYCRFYNDPNLPQNERERIAFHTFFGKERYDSNLDIYNYNFFGNSGKFVIIKNNNNELQPIIFENDTDIKINITTQPYLNTFKIVKFEIIDEKGYKYVFDEIETSSSINYTYQKKQNNTLVYPSIDDYSYDEYNSSWKIKQVKSPNGITICDFFYTNNYYTYSTPLNTIENDLGNFLINFNLSHFPENVNFLKPKKIQSYNHVTILGKIIDSIQFYNNTTIFFTHSEHVEYGSGNKKLENIQVKFNNSTLHDINLQYEIHNNTSHPILNTSFRRLFLKSFDVNNQKYQLEYYLPNLLEGWGSFNKDDFGYYNGGDFDNSNKEYVKYGSLLNIKYPTGGVKKFVFESNTYGYINNNILTIDELFENSDNRIPIVINKNFSSNVQNFNYNPNLESLIIHLTQDQVVTFAKNTATGNELYLNNTNFQIIPMVLLPGYYYDPTSNMNLAVTYDMLRDDFDRPSTGFGYAMLQNEVRLNLKKGFYKITFHKLDEIINPETPNHNNGNISVSLNVKYARMNYQNLKHFIYGGGLRIKEILSLDNDIEKSKIEFNYNLTDLNYNLNYQNISSGSLLKSDKKVYNLGFESIFAYEPTAGCKILFPKSYKVTEHNTSNFNFLLKGNFVGYKNVCKEYKNSDGLNNGKECFEFTSLIDNPVDLSSQVYPFPPIPLFDYKLGNLKMNVVYDVNGRMLKKVENEMEYFVRNEFNYAWIYQNPIQNNPFDIYYPSFNVKKMPLSNRFSHMDPNPFCLIYATHWFLNHYDVWDVPNDSNYGWGMYSYQTGFANVTKTTVTEYFDNNTSLEFVKEYIYHPIKKNLIKEEKISNFSYQNEVFEKKYHYAFEGLPSISYSLSSQENNALQKLVDLNRKNEVIYSEIYRNGASQNSELITFNEFSADLVMPSKVLISKNNTTSTGGGMMQLNENFEERIKFLNYNTNGHVTNILKDGVSKVSYIYAYHHTLPVAKLENIAYDQIPSNLIAAIQQATDTTNYNEQNVVNALNALRTSTDANMQKAMITTYVYKPLVGVTKITDPKGDTQTFLYDTFNRLKEVRDKDNNLLQESEYWYRTQN